MKQEYLAPCDECGGRCCRYVAIGIDRPRSKNDYDTMRWYLAHKDVNVFIDHEKNWFVEFRTPCEEQDANSRCLIYGRRPAICRKHGNTEGGCEFYDTPYSEYFSSLEELESYLDSKGIDWRPKKKNLK